MLSQDCLVEVHVSARCSREYLCSNRCTISLGDQQSAETRTDGQMKLRPVFRVEACSIAAYDTHMLPLSRCCCFGRRVGTRSLTPRSSSYVRQSAELEATRCRLRCSRQRKLARSRMSLREKKISSQCTEQVAFRPRPLYLGELARYTDEHYSCLPLSCSVLG